MPTYISHDTSHGNQTVTLVPVTPDQKTTLRNLMSLYLHDLSEYTDTLSISASGVYHYDGLGLYFTDQALVPLFIFNGDNLAGFILLNRPPYAPAETDFCLNELFVLRGFRGRGIARSAVSECFRQYPGRYVVRQFTRNVPAIGFWRRLFARLSIENIEYRMSRGEPCTMHAFTV